jgi:pimeloyl-ACP methyl ester carboxylesterase
MASANLVFERRGRGPPLLLLHGLGSSLRMWDPVRPLLEAHLDVIALDLPGHGASPVSMPAASSMRALALEVAACLDRLEIPTAHIAGNSLGGWLALELAKMGRARSVTALSPAGLWRGNTPAYNVVLFHIFRTIARWLGSVFSRLAGNPIARTILFWQFFGRPWAIPKAAAIEAANAFASAPGFDAILAASLRDRFHGGNAIEIPVSIAWGARDVFLLPWQSRFQDELPPQTQWSKLDGCGHVPTFDDPDAVARVILGTTAVDD